MRRSFMSTFTTPITCVKDMTFADLIDLVDRAEGRLR